MAKKSEEENFCCVGQYQVMIPYRDLEKFVRIANNFEALLDRMDKQEKQLAALRGMYLEALEKIKEMEKYL